MTGHKVARNLIEQEPGREVRYARYAVGIPNLANQRAQRQTGGAADNVQSGRQAGFSTLEKAAKADHETADGYGNVVAVPCDGWRVIVCKDDLQWIVQRRKNGGADRPWRAVGYCRTRKALVRLCAASCGQIDPAAAAALAALPENFGGVA